MVYFCMSAYPLLILRRSCLFICKLLLAPRDLASSNNGQEMLVLAWKFRPILNQYVHTNVVYVSLDDNDTIQVKSQSEMVFFSWRK